MLLLIATEVVEEEFSYRVRVSLLPFIVLQLSFSLPTDDVAVS